MDTQARIESSESTVSAYGASEKFYKDVVTIKHSTYGFKLYLNLEGVLCRSETVYDRKLVERRAKELTEMVVEYLEAKDFANTLRRQVINFTESYLHREELDSTDPNYAASVAQNWANKQQEYRDRQKAYDLKRQQEKEILETKKLEEG